MIKVMFSLTREERKGLIRFLDDVVYELPDFSDGEVEQVRKVVLKLISDTLTELMKDNYTAGAIYEYMKLEATSGLYELFSLLNINYTKIKLVEFYSIERVFERLISYKDSRIMRKGVKDFTAEFNEDLTFFVLRLDVE